MSEKKHSRRSSVVIIILSLLIAFAIVGGSLFFIGRAYLQSLFPSVFRPSEDIRISTVDREPMDSKYLTQSDKYIFDGGDLIPDSEQSAVVDKMMMFYSETGVQPYLYMPADIDGEKKPTKREIESHLLAQYDLLFGDDEGHFILFYFIYPSGNYITYYAVGNDAARFTLDNEACEIVMDCVEYYYKTSGDNGSYSDMFSDIFKKSAERIMGGITPPPNPKGIGKNLIIATVIFAVVDAIAVIVTVKLVSVEFFNIKEKQKKEQEFRDKVKRKKRRKKG